MDRCSGKSVSFPVVHGFMEDVVSELQTVKLATWRQAIIPNFVRTVINKTEIGRLYIAASERGMETPHTSNSLSDSGLSYDVFRSEIMWVYRKMILENRTGDTY